MDAQVRVRPRADIKSFFVETRGTLTDISHPARAPAPLPCQIVPRDEFIFGALRVRCRLNSNRDTISSFSKIGYRSVHTAISNVCTSSRQIFIDFPNTGVRVCFVLARRTY